MNDSTFFAVNSNLRGCGVRMALKTRHVAAAFADRIADHVTVIVDCQDRDDQHEFLDVTIKADNTGWCAYVTLSGSSGNVPKIDSLHVMNSRGKVSHRHPVVRAVMDAAIAFTGDDA